MNAEKVAVCLRSAVSDAGGVTKWAERNHVTNAYVHYVIAGDRAPGKAILQALGLERVITYRKKGK